MVIGLFQVSTDATEWRNGFKKEKSGLAQMVTDLTAFPVFV